jgi:hypothetical protein
MAYYPKSKIKTNLVTNGDEYLRVDTREPYSGFYWINSRNQAFSGKTPQDKPTVSLVKSPVSTPISDTTDPLDTSVNWVTKYNPKITNQKPGDIPSRYQAAPTQEQYDTGEFQRYFTKKTNQNIYYEISKKNYERLINQDSSVLWQLYNGISLPWQLTGNKQEVFKTNRNIVLLTEQQQNLPGFSKIFKENYLQYYQE